MNYKQLNAWQESMKLAVMSFGITDNSSRYLSDQIRKSSVSIPSNIAEGLTRMYKKQKLLFLNDSLLSLAGLETQFILAQKLNYLNDNCACLDQVYKVKKLIPGIIIAIRKTQENNYPFLQRIFTANVHYECLLRMFTTNVYFECSVRMFTANVTHFIKLNLKSFTL